MTTPGLDLVSIHEAIAETLRARVARAVSVYPFDPGDGARDFPCLVVRPREPWVEYHETFGDNALQGVEFDVVAMVAAPRLDAWLALAAFASNAPESGSSIRGALETDNTLSGNVGNVVVYRCLAPVLVEGDQSGQTSVWELTFECALLEHRGGS